MFGGGKKRHEKHSEVVDALSGISEGIVRALKPHPRNQSPSHASVDSQSTTSYMCKCISKQTGSAERSVAYPDHTTS